MKLENQVCSLDLAKRLKELGVKQDSYFKWEQWPGNHPWHIDKYTPGSNVVRLFLIAKNMSERLSQLRHSRMPMMQGVQIMQNEKVRFY
jgi:hypothetical protein